MRMAADMARLLDLDLFGLFVEEERLFGLASLPFAREFKPIGGGWHALDSDQLSRDLSMAAKSAERAFAEASRTLPTRCQFEVVRGSMAETIASNLRAGDIVMLAESASPFECANSELPAIADAAFRSEAAVLLVPGRVARRAGTIVAILTEPDDPSIEAAAAVAAAAKEDLIVIETFKSVGAGRAYEELLAKGTRISRVSVGRSPLRDASGIAAAFDQMRERLVVMSRNDVAIAALIAGVRQVPILVVEPRPDGTGNGHEARTAA
jgi:hypothetical protein